MVCSLSVSGVGGEQYALSYSCCLLYYHRSIVFLPGYSGKAVRHPTLRTFSWHGVRPLRLLLYKFGSAYEQLMCDAVLVQPQIAS